jgi:tetratricopeptide (TPR) repeat protein
MPMQLKKNICLFVLLLFVLTKASAQANDFNYRTSLKKTITADDTAYLKTVLYELSKPSGVFRYDIYNYDLYTSKVSFDEVKPASFKEIEKLAKQIDTAKKPISRANLYFDIGGNYLNLNRKALAHNAFISAYNQLVPFINSPPADSLVLITIAKAMMNLDSVERSIYFYEKLKAVNTNCDYVASPLLITIYIQMGKMAEAANLKDEILKKWPESIAAHSADLLVQFNSFAQLAQYRIDFLKSDRFFNQPPDSIFDFSRLKKQYEKYPDDLLWEQLYKGWLVSSINIRNIIYYTAKGGGEGDTIFKLSPIEKLLLIGLRSDFERIAKAKQNHNKFFAYQTLGAIDFFNGDYKSSIKWYNKAIKQKTVKESTSVSNTAEIYDNIEACYLFLGDTAQAEKTVIRKIKNQPAINPQSEDYIELTYYNLINKGIAQAQINSKKAIEIDSSNKMGYNGLAICNMILGDYTFAKQQLVTAYKMDRNSDITNLLFGINSILAGDERTAYIMLNNAYTLAGANKKNLSTIDEIMLRFYGKEEF